MSDAIVIVSLAPWARKGAWWRAATAALRADLLARPAAVLMSYFIAGHGGDSGAISTNEAVQLRGWATSIPGWRERADSGQFPLRFASAGTATSAVEIRARNSR